MTALHKRCSCVNGRCWARSNVTYTGPVPWNPTLLKYDILRPHPNFPVTVEYFYPLCGQSFTKSCSQGSVPQCNRPWRRHAHRNSLRTHGSVQFQVQNGAVFKCNMSSYRQCDISKHPIPRILCRHIIKTHEHEKRGVVTLTCASGTNCMEC